MVHTLILWSCGILLCASLRLASHPLSIIRHVYKDIYVQHASSSACKQVTAPPDSTSERWLLHQQHHTHPCYSHECVLNMTQKISCWIKSLFSFLCAQKYSRSFIKLRLNHWRHMNYFINVLTTFLGLEHVSCVAVYAGSESSRISSKIS